jgi:prepilin signal peptidase PulO-like enzyme (type II secretory pathway)
MPVLSLAIAAGVLGTFIGSFLNVVVHRLPRNLSVVHPPSRCGACGTAIRWHDNLPVIGWLCLGGRCRACGTRFSIRYLLAELACGGLTAATVAWAFHRPLPAADGPAGLTLAVVAAAVLVALLWWLAVAALIDLEHTIIPDELTKPLQLAAPALAAIAFTPLAVEPQPWVVALAVHRDVFGTVSFTPERLLPWVLGGGVVAVAVLLASLPLARRIYGPHGWTADDHRGFSRGVQWFAACSLVHSLAISVTLWLTGVSPWVLAAAQALAGSLAGWFSLYLVGFLGTVAFRRNAMGFGDVKFLAPIGAFTGPVGVLYVFAVAAVLGAVVGIPRRLLGGSREIPFGPFLAIAAVIVLLLGGRLHGLLFPA